MLHRELDQAGQVFDAQLGHQPAAIGFDRFRRQGENPGNLGAGIALDHHLQDLSLPSAQSLQRADLRSMLALLDEILHQHLRHFFAEVAMAGMDRPHGLDQHFAGRAFEQVAMRARLQRAIEMF